MLDPAITLRPAQPDDEAFLFDLYASTRREEMAAWGLDDVVLAQMIKMQYAGQQGTYHARFPGADHHIILRDDRPVGRLLVDRTGAQMVLVDVALMPEARGVGIGTELVRALQAEATEKGLPLRLKVVLTNPARRLYRRLGFVALSDDGVYEQMEWRSDKILS
jgi:ribosomal protein S18 acetylase RimI-like enzyme